MARLNSVSLRLSCEERKLLDGLADRLQRSPSDTVRLLIREFARSFIEHEQTARVATRSLATTAIAATQCFQEETR
jgi:predicted transcriptional regulator